MTFAQSPAPVARPPEPRKALVLIDFQSDFIDENHGRLPVTNVAPFVDRLANLACQFRSKGIVAFVQSEFHDARSALSPEWGTYNIFLKESLPETTQSTEPSRRHRRGRSSAAQGSIDPEAFLQAGIEDEHRVCWPGSAGAQLVPSIADVLDTKRDLKVTKSHYSAFKDTTLLNQLRVRMIQHLYIAGSLSNVGVYATVTDAVRHGFEVTLIEDCLGYRDEQCHIQAVTQMVDMMGAAGVDYQELMDDLAGLLGDVINEEDLGSAFQISVAPARARPAALPIPGAPVSPEHRQQQVEDWLVDREAHQRRSSQNNIDGYGISDALEVDADGDCDSYASGRSPGSLPRETTTGSVSPPTRASTVSNAADPGDSTKSSQRSSVPRSPSGSTQYKVGRPRVRAPRPVSGLSIPSSSAETSRTPTSLRKSIMTAIASSSKPIASETLINSSLSADLEVDPSEHNTKRTRRIHVDLDALVAAIEQAPKRKKKIKNTASLIGAAEQIGEGDCSNTGNIISYAAADSAFYALKRGVKWQKMFHRTGEVPRLVAVQGAIDEATGTEPIYRHPADESPEMQPFDETVNTLRLAAEKHVGHSLNHVLIQYYRSGEDNISEHSDKTLDITRGSSIINFSLGAQRVMTLRTKKPDSVPVDIGTSSRGEPKPDEQGPDRLTQRIPLMHNSIFVLGPLTNQYWLHSVRADKRPDKEKGQEELAYDGERISLTFRSIATYVDREKGLIWGQGARQKTEPPAYNDNGKQPERGRGFGRLLEGEEAEREGEEMIRAFGQENHRSSTWDWERWYGEGFDVVNFETRSG